MARSEADKDAETIWRWRRRRKGEDDYDYDERMGHPAPSVKNVTSQEYFCQRCHGMELERQSRALQSAGVGAKQCFIMTALPRITGIPASSILSSRKIYLRCRCYGYSGLRPKQGYRTILVPT